MQFKLTAVLLLALPVFGQTPNLPDVVPNLNGAIPADTLSNENLGVILHYPSGWTASETFYDPVLFNPDPNAPANRCTHIELRAQAPANANGAFVSWSILAVLDRRCLKIGPFPKSIEDRSKISEVSRAICEAFKGSPFVPASGMDFEANLAENGKLKMVIVQLSGKTTLSALTGHPAPQNGDTSIDTAMSIAEVKDRWILWAAISDPATTEMFKAQPIEQFWHK